jgi:hypothetical protein
MLQYRDMTAQPTDATANGRNPLTLAPLPVGHLTGLDIWDRVDQSGSAKPATQPDAVEEDAANRVVVETGGLASHSGQLPCRVDETNTSPDHEPH